MHIETLERRCVLDSGAGYLLVSDYDGNSVLRYDAATGAFVDTIVSKHSGGLNQPQGLVFGPHDHSLYVTSGEFTPSSDPRTAVLRYDGTTGTFIDRFADDDRLDGPHAVVFGPDGNLYVADGFSFATGDTKPSKIVRYNGTTGEYMDDFVPPDSGGLKGPFALVFGPSGSGPRELDLYVVSRRTDSIKRYDGATGAYLGDFVASGSGGLDAPIALTFGPDGNLYVSAGFGTPSAVFRFQGPTGKDPGAPLPSLGNDGAVFVASGSGGLLDTFGLIFGPDGNGDGNQDLYLPSFKLVGSNKADEKYSTIKRYDGLTGAFINTFVTENSGGLDQPNYLIFTETDPVTLAYTGTSKTGAATPPPTSSAETALGESLALAADPPSVAASGMSLVGQWDGHDHLYADLWAEEITSGRFKGRTFAYLAHFGNQGGVDIVEITDPTSPTLASTFIGTGGDNELVDVQVENGIGYFSSNTDGSVYIVDVSNPYKPTQLARIDESMGGLGRVHTLFVDGRFLYEVHPRFPEIRVFDVSNPSRPIFVRSIPSPSGRGIHEATVRNGRLYTAEFWNGGRADIFDVSNVGNLVAPVPLLGTFKSGDATHTSLATEDGQFLIVTHEWAGHPLEIYDISNPAQATLASTIHVPRTDTFAFHQPVVVGNLLYVASYEAGLRVYNIANPYDPEFVSDYDTYTGPYSEEGECAGLEGHSAGVNSDIEQGGGPLECGAWGVFPFLGNDRILVSDLDGGLVIVSLDNPSSVAAATDAALLSITESPAEPKVLTAESRASAAEPSIVNGGGQLLVADTDGGE